jgi:hypothetical protein
MVKIKQYAENINGSYSGLNIFPQDYFMFAAGGHDE